MRVLSCLNACRAKKGFSQSIDVFLEEVRVKKREFRPSLGREAMDMLEAASGAARIKQQQRPRKSQKRRDFLTNKICRRLFLNCVGTFVFVFFKVVPRMNTHVDF